METYYEESGTLSEDVRDRFTLDAWTVEQTEATAMYDGTSITSPNPDAYRVTLDSSVFQYSQTYSLLLRVFDYENSNPTNFTFASLDFSKKIEVQGTASTQSEFDCDYSKLSVGKTMSCVITPRDDNSDKVFVDVDKMKLSLLVNDTLSEVQPTCTRNSTGFIACTVTGPPSSNITTAALVLSLTDTNETVTSQDVSIYAAPDNTTTMTCKDTTGRGSEYPVLVAPTEATSYECTITPKINGVTTKALLMAFDVAFAGMSATAVTQGDAISTGGDGDDASAPQAYAESFVFTYSANSRTGVTSITNGVSAIPVMVTVHDYPDSTSYSVCDASVALGGDTVCTIYARKERRPIVTASSYFNPMVFSTWAFDYTYAQTQEFGWTNTGFGTTTMCESRACPDNWPNPGTSTSYSTSFTFNTTQLEPFSSQQVQLNTELTSHMYILIYFFFLFFLFLSS